MPMTSSPTNLDRPILRNTEVRRNELTQANTMLKSKREFLVKAQDEMRHTGAILLKEGQQIRHKHGKHKGEFHGRVVKVFPTLGIVEVKPFGGTKYRNVNFSEVLEIISLPQ